MASLISGKVHDPAGAPLSFARLYIVDGPVSVPDIAILSGSDGSFRLDVPAPGRYRLGCALDGYATRTVEVDVVANAETRVEITLTPD